MSDTKTFYDFGNGLVSAHKHPNGGGWVADLATVDSTVFVGPDARVSGNAQVSDYAEISGYARVSGNAQVSGNAKVSGTAIIKDNLWINGPIRSDGYQFILAPCSDGVFRILAGCRYFIIPEAKKYWGDKNHHKHKESIFIVEYLEKMKEIRKL